MILMIDNYDSFTFNLLQYLGELGQIAEVIRNDKIDVASALKQNPKAIIISPGPSTPKNAGICLELIQETSTQNIPLLGVCLGAQAIGEAFGGNVVQASNIMHGKTSSIQHHGKNLFAKLSNPLSVVRYHSLIVDKESLPLCLQIDATSKDDDVIMALSHKTKPIYGVQFHPESIDTQEGKKLLSNFLKLASLTDETIKQSAPTKQRAK